MPDHSAPRFSGRQLAGWTAAVLGVLAFLWLARGWIRPGEEDAQLRNRRTLAELTRKTEGIREGANDIVTARMDETLTAFPPATTDAAVTNAASATLEDSVATLASRSEPVFSTLRTPPGADVQGLAISMWNPATQEGQLTVQRLPPSSRGLIYEVWLVGERPVSAGTFSVDESGRAKFSYRPAAPVSTVSAVLVSRERNDGQPAHTAPREIVLTSE